MMPADGWKVLDLCGGIATRILIRYNFNDAGYSVEITDTSKIWAETITKDDIIQRSRECGCGIDPGEDDEQFRIFNETITSTLERKEGTEVFLWGKTDHDPHVLNLFALLPSPLPPFQWQVKLREKRCHYMGDTFVMPALTVAARLRYQIQGLVSEIHEKDRIICKLADRLELSGNDLATVFPGAAKVRTNKKGSQREQLAKHVKSLGDFDETVWLPQHDLRDEDLDVSSINDVLDQLSNTNDGIDPGEHSRKWWSGWWKPMKPSVLSGIERSEGPNKPGLAQEVSQDDFQRQETPELVHESRVRRLKFKVNSSPGPAQDGVVANSFPDDESTTEEEDDLDIMPSPHFTKSPASGSQFSNAVSNKSQRSNRSPSPQDGAPYESNVKKVSAKTLTSKIGILGGKPRLEATLESRTTEPPQPGRSRLGARLGLIGGKLKPPEEARNGQDANQRAQSIRAEKVTPEANEAVRNESGITLSQTPPTKPTATAPLDSDGAAHIVSPRQTSVERADDKRKQLKRDLAVKSKSEPKKKRKF